jgi:hypothetical protein
VHQQGWEPPGTGGRSVPEEFLVRVGLVLVLGYLAVVACRQAVTDWHYELAGLADPFLGRPAPWWSIGLGAIASVLVAIAWLSVRAVAARLSGPNASGSAAGASRDDIRGKRPWGRPIRWWWILAAAWGAYAVGGVATVLAGGPVDHPATMRFTIGAPVSTTFNVPATCRSAPGKPLVVAEVIPDAAGLPILGVRNAATGDPDTRTDAAGHPIGVTLELTSDRGEGGAFVVPGLPARVPMYRLDMGIDGPLAGPETTFMRAYFYLAQEVDDRGSAGTLRAAATRTRLQFQVVNDLIPDDPWPQTYDLGISWTCDLDGTKTTPGTVSAPSPRPSPNPVATPRPSPSISHVEPDGVPIQLRLVTSSDQATVTIDGATVVRSSDLGVEGDATATADGGRFRLAQPGSRAAEGRTVGATFGVVLAGLDAGSSFDIAIDQGTLGMTAATLSNDLGTEPVPVFVRLVALRPGEPPVRDIWSAMWFVQPVAATEPQ